MEINELEMKALTIRKSVLELIYQAKRVILVRIFLVPIF